MCCLILEGTTRSTNAHYIILLPKPHYEPGAGAPAGNMVDKSDYLEGYGVVACCLEVAGWRASWLYLVVEHFRYCQSMCWTRNGSMH